MLEADRSKAARRVFFYVAVALLFLFGLVLSIFGIYLNEIWKGQWYLFFSKLMEHTGYVIGVVAVLSLVSEHLAQLTIIERFSEDLAKRIRNLVLEHIPGVENAGLVQIIPEMNFELLFDQLENGDELYWLDTFAPSSIMWIKDVVDAARRGAVMKFLVLSPYSKLAPLRANELGSFFLPKDFIRELTGFEKRLTEARDILETDKRKNIDVLLYEDLLGCPIYLIRKKGVPVKALSSFYLGKATGTKFPHFEWTNSGPDNFIRELDTYVISKWNRAAQAKRISAQPDHTDP